MTAMNLYTHRAVRTKLSISMSRTSSLRYPDDRALWMAKKMSKMPIRRRVIWVHRGGMPDYICQRGRRSAAWSAVLDHQIGQSHEKSQKPALRMYGVDVGENGTLDDLRQVRCHLKDILQTGGAIQLCTDSHDCGMRQTC